MHEPHREPSGAPGSLLGVLVGAAGALLVAALGCGPSAERAPTTTAAPAEDAAASGADSAPVRASSEECGPDEGGAVPCPPVDESVADARASFTEAVRLYGERDYAGALAKFRAAHALEPRPAILFNVARCQEELADVQGALQTYQEILHGSGEPLPAPMQQLVQQRITALEQRTAQP